LQDDQLHFVFANELIDALPVHLVRVQAGQLEELYVTLSDNRLVLEPAPLSTPGLASYFERLDLLPGEGCRAEVNLAALDWMRAAAARLSRGMLLVLDYGYPAEELFSPERRLGTLLCYARHTLNSEPFARVGQQDITSHVDFSSLRWAGESSGLVTLGLVSQRQLLYNLGWASLRRGVERLSLGQAERQANLRALDGLVDLQGLGRVRALIQQRGLGDFVPIGLAGGPALDWLAPPVLRSEHIRLPDPVEADGPIDVEAQWAELWRTESQAEVTTASQGWMTGAMRDR
jgi:SAM-dependent MidA family methyltransferase